MEFLQVMFLAGGVVLSDFFALLVELVEIFAEVLAASLGHVGAQLVNVGGDGALCRLGSFCAVAQESSTLIQVVQSPPQDVSLSLIG